MDARMAELLPVTYFHVVFTLPEGLNALIMSNQERLYPLLFRAAWETLRQLSLDEKHLGAEPGMLAVLHTWGQQLAYHPHLHCVVPGGGLRPKTGEWVASRPTFFLPVKALSAVFRGIWAVVSGFIGFFRDKVWPVIRWVIDKVATYYRGLWSVISAVF